MRRYAGVSKEEGRNGSFAAGHPAQPGSGNARGTAGARCTRRSAQEAHRAVASGQSQAQGGADEGCLPQAVVPLRAMCP